MIINDFLYYTTLILIYDALCSFRLYYIQFKEVKILWGPGSGGRITQRPFNSQEDTIKFEQFAMKENSPETIWQMSLLFIWISLKLINQNKGAMLNDPTFFKN